MDNDNLTYSNDRKTSGIEINETLDGKKVEPGTGESANTRKPSANGNATSDIPKRKGDRWIWGIYIILIIISIIEPYSASSREVHADNIYGPLIGQIKYLAIGFALLWVIQKIHYKFYRKLAWLWALVSLLLLVLSLFTGESINGASRAIMIPHTTVSIQPAEIVKLTVVIWLSAIMAKNQITRGVSTKGCIYCAVIVLTFGLLLYPNGLTNMLLLMVVSISMFLIGGIEMKKFWIIIGIYLILGAGVVQFKIKKEHASGDAVEQVDTGAVDGKTSGTADRSSTWQNRLSRYMAGVSPKDTINDKNRQVIFANFAMARGGVIGSGPGTSQESARLPLAFSDYIYSIIVEDSGIVGGILLLLVYITLVFRAGVVAYNCSRTFPALLIMGCAVMIVFQALVHMAIVTGVFPVSGQPLPLISRGGTSIVIMSIAFGMMLSVSKFAVQKGNKKEVKAEQEELPESILSINPSQIYEIDSRK